MYREIIIIIVFLAGLIFCITRKSKKEGFSLEGKCPTILIQKGNELLLFNQNRARIPGVNPIRFNNLDEYVQFIKWQRRLGIRCPVLYFQQTYDAQNNLGWRVLDNPIYPTSGMLTSLPPLRGLKETLLYDANRLDPPFNIGDYPAYDPMNQYIGDYTPLDKMFHQSGISDNPMDANYVPPSFFDDGYYFKKNNIPLKSTNKPPNYLNQGKYVFDSTTGDRNKYYSNMGKYIQAKDKAAEYGQPMTTDNTQNNNKQYSNMSEYIAQRDSNTLAQEAMKPSTN